MLTFKGVHRLDHPFGEDFDSTSLDFIWEHNGLNTQHDHLLYPGLSAASDNNACIPDRSTTVALSDIQLRSAVSVQLSNITHTPSDKVQAGAEINQWTGATDTGVQLFDYTHQQSTVNSSPQETSASSNSPSNDHRMHTCNHCRNTYSKARHLANHIKRHTLLRHCPFQTCTTQLADQKEVDRHVAKVHGESVLICPARGCHKTFAGRPDALQRHLRGQRHRARYGTFGY